MTLELIFLETKKNAIKGLLLVIGLFLASQNANAQLTVAGSQTANDLAQMLAGPGVTVTNAVFNNCEPVAQGKFWVTPPKLS